MTGGATGIGAATVRHFVQHGWNVALGFYGDDEAPIAAEIAAAAQADGCLVLPIPLDVTNDEQCRAAADRIAAAFGRLDAVVSSAGTTRVVPQRDLDGLDADDFDLTSKVNTLGPFQVIRACTPMLRAGRGAAVIISSYGGLFGGGSSIAYAASKGATNTLTLSLARVLAPEVRVNAVCPAIVSGGIAARSDPEGFAARSARQVALAPLSKVASPEEVAADVFWLAAGTTLMTGNVLALDCGMHLNGDAIG